MTRAIKILFFLLVTALAIKGQEIDENILLNKHYLKRMAEFRSNPVKQGQIVFFGNSITEMGKWDTYFPNQAIANRGISGDNTDGMIARIHEVAAACPSKIFIMAGINDISLQRSNEVILRQTKLLIRQIMATCPESQIYVQSVLPINTEKLKYGRLKGKEKQIEDYNVLLKALCQEMEVKYIDIYSLLLGQPLQLAPQYTRDGLHINQEAYQVWADEIKNYVLQ